MLYVSLPIPHTKPFVDMVLPTINQMWAQWSLCPLVFLWYLFISSITMFLLLYDTWVSYFYSYFLFLTDSVIRLRSSLCRRLKVELESDAASRTVKQRALQQPALKQRTTVKRDLVSRVSLQCTVVKPTYAPGTLLYSVTDEEKLTSDSCLCDACFRHVDRRANCPSYRKRPLVKQPTDTTLMLSSPPLNT